MRTALVLDTTIQSRNLSKNNRPITLLQQLAHMRLAHFLTEPAIRRSALAFFEVFVARAAAMGLFRAAAQAARVAFLGQASQCLLRFAFTFHGKNPAYGRKTAGAIAERAGFHGRLALQQK